MNRGTTSGGDPIESPDATTETGRFAVARRFPLVVVLAALASGIVVGCYVSIGPVIWWSVALVSLVLWRPRRARPLSVWLVLLAVMATGAAWHQLRWNFFPADELGRFARRQTSPVCIEAVALQRPVLVPARPADPLCTLPQGDQSRLEVSLLRLRNRTVWQPVSGRALLAVEGHLLGVAPGDVLRVVAQLSRPWPAQNAGQFAFSDHERSQRRLCRLKAAYPDCVVVRSKVSRWSLRWLVQRLRNGSNDMLWHHLGHPRSDLAAAVLLGAREQLDRDRVEAFFHTGTIHLLAISGLHVGIMASGFFWVARISLFPLRAALGTAMVCTILYALLTDARAPVVRAAILVCMICFGWILRRPTAAFNSLAAAAIVVLALNPCELFRVGAQLSFLAVAVLVWFGPMLMWSPPQDPLPRLVYHSRPWWVRVGRHVGRGLLRLAIAGALIWTITLPLVMHRFHLIAPAALVLNVFLWIPITLALFAGFAVLLVGWLVPPLATLCGSICAAALWMLESCVQVVQPLAGSHFWVAGPSLGWVVGFYLLLGVSATVPWLRANGKRSLVLIATWIAVGTGISVWPALDRGQPPSQLNCTFLAVGHGTCVLLELPNGQNLVYDAGSLGAPHLPVSAISSVLWWRGIHHLDAVILSHADADHYNAVPGLLQRFTVGAVYVSPVMFDDRNDALDVLRAAIERANVPIEIIHRGVRLPLGDETDIHVLHPPRRGTLGSDNASSIVLDLRYGGRRMILPGDIEQEGLQSLLHHRAIDCDVALAPHHGSPHSDPARFAAWCSPTWVIVSGGHRAGVGEVVSLFEKAGVKVLHTATHDAVRVTFSRTEMEVSRWSRPP